MAFYNQLYRIFLQEIIIYFKNRDNSFLRPRPSVTNKVIIESDIGCNLMIHHKCLHLSAAKSLEALRECYGVYRM